MNRLQQLQAVVDADLPLTTNLANASAVLNLMPHINWCGFYLAEGQVLYLGPFQGTVACTAIPFGKGVCGTAARLKQTILVDDVNTFEGHIACSALSRSELVVPILKDGTVKGVIDIDSPVLARFTEVEQREVEQMAAFLAETVF